MKKPFLSVVPDIVSKYGTTVSRKDFIAYCTEHDVAKPAEATIPKSGRGWFNLEIYLDKARQFQKIMNPAPVKDLSDAEIETKINTQFQTLDTMTLGVINGSFKSLVVSGNPGIGKTYTMERILNDAANNSKILLTPVKGYVKASGLYKLLWEGRHKECVTLFDDTDAIFRDEVALNLLKTALDTTIKRHICWRSEKVFEAEDGDDIPHDFDFFGSAIFISNLNFPKLIAQGGKFAPHLEAIMSRSFFIDMNLNTNREMLIRIRGMIPTILASIRPQDQKVILKYIEDNTDKFREISLRTLVKCGVLWRASGKNYTMFENLANLTMLRK
jgi:hypothetical protein